MLGALQGFFNAYRVSFTKGPEAIAEFYSEPCIKARNGVVRVNSTRADTTKLFADVDAQYRARGFADADFIPIDMRPLGANSALATIKWSYKDSNNEALWQTTFSYNLYKRDGAWKILVQTMHD